MKKVLLVLCAVFAAMFSQAQLPSGSVAPNFTATDINGVEYTMYDYLDMGYQVIIDVSATWCGPCWNYHNSGTLEDIYAAHGPDGDQTIMVFMVEGDGTTNTNCLYGSTGCNSSTQGDWVTNTPYPIIDNADIANAYAITYYPTTFLICPSRTIIDSESIQPSEATIMSFFDNASCQPASESVDPGLNQYLGDAASCGDAHVVVQLINMGLNDLMACTITVTGGTGGPVVFDWTGNLSTYEMEMVDLGTVSINGDTNLTISITSADDNTLNNTLNALVSVATEATTHIRIDISTDAWPGEETWEILNENGNSVADGGPYAPNGNATDPVTVTEDRWVPGTGCYTFVIYDAFGDGMHGSQWGSVDGTCQVYGVDGSGNAMDMIYDYNGSYDYESDGGAASVTSVVTVNENENVSILNAYPNPTSDITTIGYVLGQGGDVRFDVVNLLGETVLTENLGNKLTGSYSQQLDMSTLSSGVYMVNVVCNGATTTLRVNLNK